jgi:hypothetical protein
MIAGGLFVIAVARAQDATPPDADQLFRRSGNDTPMYFRGVPSNCVFDVANDGTNYLLVAFDPTAAVAVSPRVVRLAPQERQPVELRLASTTDPIPLFYSVSQSPTPFATHTNRYRAYLDGETVMCVPVPQPLFTSMLLRTESIVSGSRTLVTDAAMPGNTFIYTPGPFYQAAGIFARDFLYQLEGSGRYGVTAEEIRRAVDFLALKQLTANRLVGAYTYPKGAIPDHVYPDGSWAWGPGLVYGDNPAHFHRPSMDEAMCFITLAWHYGYKAAWDAAWRTWFAGKAQSFADAWNSVPRNPGTGLVTQWTTPGHIGAQGIGETTGGCVMWGFHDSYGFGGDDLGTSVLACNAARALADMYQHADDAAKCQEWDNQAGAMQNSIRAQFNGAGYLPWGVGANAPTMASPDITGYAVWSGILTAEQADAASDWFAARYLADRDAGGAADLFHMAAPFRGAVRMARKADDVYPGSHVWPHMSGEHWENLTYGYNAYQDGGYWYYMSLGIAATLTRKHPDLAREWVGNAYADIAAGAASPPYERIDGTTPVNERYNASVGPLMGMGLPAETASVILTVRTDKPAIDNLPATNITTCSANLNGYLSSTGTSATAVWVYWGATDSTTNANLWANTNFSGTNTVGTTAYTTNVTGLASNTTYYYNFYTQNASGGVWAAAGGSRSFATFGPPAVDIAGASGVGDGLATLNGILVATNGYATTVFLCWGTNDCGTVSTNPWTVINCGTAANGQPFSASVSTLTVGVRFYYRAYATNAAGAVWSGLTNFLMVEAAGYQMKITFGGYTNRSEVLTNFPVLVVLSNNINNSGFHYFATATNGYDLRFATNSTPTPNSLNYEIESWNTNSASYVWVQVPTIPGDGSGAIWAKWGDPSASSQLPCITNGATWANGYQWVSHLSGNANDAGPNRLNGTTNGTADAAGAVGRGRSFNGTSDYVGIASSSALAIGSEGTMSCWAQLANWNTSADNELINNNNAFSINCVYLSVHGTVGLHFRHNLNTTYDLSSPYESDSWVASSWHYVVARWSSAGLYLYADGIQYQSAGTASPYTQTPAAWNLGRFLGSEQQWFGGKMDEVRISSVARSTNWVWAEYMNMASNAVFNKYGAMQTLGAVPAAPTGFTATAAATNQINLAWSDNASNETGYVVQRSLDSNAWVLVVVTSANATNTSDSGLATNTLYTYRVAASNAAGLSAYCFATGMTWTAYEAWRHTQFDDRSLTNAAVSSDTADPDHDGLNNAQEYLAGTDPMNASSCLAITGLTNNPAVAGGGFVVSWQSVTGKTYSVLAATNLLTGFSTLTNALRATPTVNVYTDSVNGAGQKFYRVGVE